MPFLSPWIVLPAGFEISVESALSSPLSAANAGAEVTKIAVAAKSRAVLPITRMIPPVRHNETLRGPAAGPTRLATDY